MEENKIISKLLMYLNNNRDRELARFKRVDSGRLKQRAGSSAQMWNEMGDWVYEKWTGTKRTEKGSSV